MAINFTNLFENIGEYVQRVNDFKTFVTDLGTDLSEIEAELVGNGNYTILEGEVTRFDQYRATILSWIDQNAGKIQELILDKPTIRDELTIGDTADFASVIEAVYAAMATATEYITANGVTLSAITATRVNGSSAGTVYVSKRLDGVNAPHDGYPVIRSYNGAGQGIDSQLALTDDMALVCIADAESDGVTEGSEQFQWVGNPTAGHNYSWLVYGSGDGPVLSPIQSGSLMTNLSFQAFTDDEPDGWDVDTGTAATHIFEDDTTAKVHRGDYALKLTGDAALAAIQISQTVPSGLVPMKRYMVGFWVLGDAGVNNGTLTIQFEGTGYTADASEKITMNAAALAAATAYGWQYFWINMPAQIPDDFELVIKWTGTPSADSIWINGGGMAPAVYFNGHCAMIVASSAPFIRGDKLVYTATNDYAGVFQTAFAKLFGVQMPSGVATQADTLAT